MVAYLLVADLTVKTWRVAVLQYATAKQKHERNGKDV